MLPALRLAGRCRRADRRTPAISTDRLTAGITMPNDVRKQRLLREAHATEDGEIFNAWNAAVIMVIAAVALTIYWGVAAIVVTSATERRGDAAPGDSSMLKEARLVGNAVPEATGQNPRANNKHSDTQ